MKRLALVLLLLSTSASAMCPLPPLVPYGCRAVCVCDQYGNNCYYITVCK